MRARDHLVPALIGRRIKVSNGTMTTTGKLLRYCVQSKGQGYVEIQVILDIATLYLDGTEEVTITG